MAVSGGDPLGVPEGFWRRDEVGNALDCRDIGALFITKRRTALTLGLAATVSPETFTSVLRDSAGEALEFTRATAVSAVGVGTLDHLEAVVTDLDRSYFVQPLGELFTVARAYRRRVEELIQGRRTLSEERELYVYAAWLSELLVEAPDLHERLPTRPPGRDACPRRARGVRVHRSRRPLPQPRGRRPHRPEYRASSPRIARRGHRTRQPGTLLGTADRFGPVPGG
ncbi:MAG: hypothetical protein ACRDQY_04690 [Pseudonocardiaceae bacterium]